MKGATSFLGRAGAVLLISTSVIGAGASAPANAATEADLPASIGIVIDTVYAPGADKVAVIDQDSVAIFSSAGTLEREVAGLSGVSAALDDYNRLYVAQNTGTVAAINLETGTLEATYAIGTTNVSSLAQVGETLYFSYDSGTTTRVGEVDLATSEVSLNLFTPMPAGATLTATQYGPIANSSWRGARQTYLLVAGAAVPLTVMDQAVGSRNAVGIWGVYEGKLAVSRAGRVTFLQRSLPSPEAVTNVSISSSATPTLAVAQNRTISITAVPYVGDEGIFEYFSELRTVTLSSNVTSMAVSPTAVYATAGHKFHIIKHDRTVADPHPETFDTKYKGALSTQLIEFPTGFGEPRKIETYGFVNDIIVQFDDHIALYTADLELTAVMSSPTGFTSVAIVDDELFVVSERNGAFAAWRSQALPRNQAFPIWEASTLADVGEVTSLVGSVATGVWATTDNQDATQSVVNWSARAGDQVETINDNITTPIEFRGRIHLTPQAWTLTNPSLPVGVPWNGDVAAGETSRPTDGVTLEAFDTASVGLDGIFFNNYSQHEVYPPLDIGKGQPRVFATRPTLSAVVVGNAMTIYGVPNATNAYGVREIVLPNRIEKFAIWERYSGEVASVHALALVTHPPAAGRASWRLQAVVVDGTSFAPPGGSGTTNAIETGGFDKFADNFVKVEIASYGFGEHESASPTNSVGLLCSGGTPRSVELPFDRRFIVYLPKGATDCHFTASSWSSYQGAELVGLYAGMNGVAVESQNNRDVGLHFTALSHPGVNQGYVTSEFPSVYTDLGIFVTQIYNDILDRDPTQAELQRAASRIYYGEVSYSQFVVELIGSKEFLGTIAPLSRLYSAYFDRVPDDGGLTYWLGEMRRGFALVNVSAIFADSVEFNNTYGRLNNRQFLELVYENVLGRSPDQAGIDYWVRQMDRGMNRGAVMVAFSESNEYVNKTQASIVVRSLYYGLLEREPDPAGGAYWESVYASGGSLDELVVSFLNSKEFGDRFWIDGGGTDQWAVALQERGDTTPTISALEGGVIMVSEPLGGDDYPNPPMEDRFVWDPPTGGR